jgi:hypothetical protein
MSPNIRIRNAHFFFGLPTGNGRTKIGDSGAVEKVEFDAIFVIPTEAKRNGGIP